MSEDIFIINPSFPELNRQIILELLNTGSKIKAIKMFREATGVSLFVGKQYVDEIIVKYREKFSKFPTL